MGPAQRRASQLSPLSLLDGPPLFLGCNHSYIDMGTNEGRRFDILLEPEKRPRQGVYGFYGQVPRRELCVVGFEPNPAHALKLSRAMEGWREKARVFHIFGAAISTTNSYAQFWSDGAKKQREWGASLLNYNPGKMLHVRRAGAAHNDSQVRTISLDWFLRNHVIAAGSQNRVLAKMDIEGAEYDTVPPAVDALCESLDMVQLERHEKLLHQRYLTNLSAEDATRLNLHQFEKQSPAVQHLNAALRQMRGRSEQGTCRTRVQTLTAWCS